jgi:hypothetical protein
MYAVVPHDGYGSSLSLVETVEYIPVAGSRGRFGRLVGTLEASSG